MVAICVLSSLCYELDPVLDLCHSGIHAVAGALTSKAHHPDLGKSKYKKIYDVGQDFAQQCLLGLYIPIINHCD